MYPISSRQGTEAAHVCVSENCVYRPVGSKLSLVAVPNLLDGLRGEVPSAGETWV